MNLPKKTEKGSVFVVKAVKVKENIYWVGAVDWDVRNFHGASSFVIILGDWW